MVEVTHIKIRKSVPLAGTCSGSQSEATWNTAIASQGRAPGVNS